MESPGRPPHLSRNGQKIRRMFGSIAPRYDLANRLLSGFVDVYWRWAARRRLSGYLGPEKRVLDLCTGTGDLALSLARKSRVVGCDFCHEMLVLGQRKAQRRRVNGRIVFVEGDALRLPFPNASFEVVTIAFGLRNLESYAGGLQEMYRVLKPGGRLAVLEFSQPRIPLFRFFYRLYFTRVLPRLGRLISGREGPYSYLPESVREFPTPAELDRLILQVGFRQVQHYTLTGGIAVLHLAGK